jgi:hypothetical protein
MHAGRLPGKDAGLGSEGDGGSYRTQMMQILIDLVKPVILQE